MCERDRVHEMVGIVKSMLYRFIWEKSWRTSVEIILFMLLYMVGFMIFSDHGIQDFLKLESQWITVIHVLIKSLISILDCGCDI